MTIDKLARMTHQEFLLIREEMATREDLENMETRLLGAIREVNENVNTLVVWSKDVDRRTNIFEDKVL